jgi:hypothetical protein
MSVLVSFDVTHKARSNALDLCQAFLSPPSECHSRQFGAGLNGRDRSECAKVLPNNALVVIGASNAQDCMGMSLQINNLS